MHILRHAPLLAALSILLALAPGPMDTQEQDQRFIVLEGRAGIEVLVSCTGGNVDFTVILYPFGGGFTDVAPEGTPCSMELLSTKYPGVSMVEFSESPKEGWSEAPGRAEGESVAIKCDTEGRLIQVSATPSGWPDINPDRSLADPFECMPDAASI